MTKGSHNELLQLPTVTLFYVVTDNQGTFLTKDELIKAYCLA
jgi:hypothetical protein